MLGSHFIKFHYEIEKFESILYLHDLVGKCIKEDLDKILAPKTVVSTVPKKYLVITLTYLGKFSLQMHTRINHILKNNLPYCNIQFEKDTQQTKCKISPLLT